jgi:hypothetical protein
VAHGKAFAVRERCASTTPLVPSLYAKKCNLSVEVIDEHDVAVFFVDLREEQVAAVRGD